MRFVWLILVFTGVGTASWIDSILNGNNNYDGRKEEDIQSVLLSLTPNTPKFEYFAPFNARWPGNSEVTYSKAIGKAFRESHNDEEFEYIVVGGGGAGCPLARTLAENGYKTLLLERGGLREESFLTWDHNGIGRASNDPNIVQAIVTKSGVISHLGSVLGGGTSVNFGFYIEEDAEYFDQINTIIGDSQALQYSAFQSAYDWIREKVAFKSRPKANYTEHLSKHYQNLAQAHGPGGYKYKLEPRSEWSGYSTFDMGFRAAADVLLGNIGHDFPNNLTISVKSEATKIIFQKNETTGKNRAVCVEYRIRDENTPQPAILSKPKRGVGILQSYANFRQWLTWYPKVNAIARLTLPELAQTHERIKRVCLDPHSRNAEIILSAGAIMTPWLLFNSGIGPKEEVDKLGVPLVAHMPSLGRNLGDRPFLPIAYFLDSESGVRRSEPSILTSTALATLTAEDTFPDLPNPQANLPADDVEKAEPISSPEDSELRYMLIGPGKESCPNLRLSSEPSVDAAISYKRAIMSEAFWPLGLPQVAFASSRPRVHAFMEKPEPTCANGVYEELSGGKFLEGTAVSTRYFFPPALRGSLLVDVAMQALSICGEESTQISGSRLRGQAAPPLLALCPFLRPIVRCLRTTVAQVIALPTPRSLGSVTVGGNDGVSPVVDANYFADPNDVKDMAMATSWLLQAMQTTREFDGVFEKLDRNLKLRDVFNDQCPLLVRTKLADLLDRVSRFFSDYFSSQEIAFVERSLEGFHHDGSVRGMLEELQGLSATGELDVENITLSDLNELDILRGSEAWSFGNRLTKNKYLSFPPMLPNPRSYQEVSAFVKRYATSMWHWHGSARLGEVTESQTFRLKHEDLEGVSVIDASVLPRLTRYNPQATIMALGRYGGMLKIAQRDL